QRILLRRAQVNHLRAQLWQFKRNAFNLDRDPVTGKRCMCASIHDKKPRSRIAAQDSLDALAVKGAVGLDQIFIGDVDRSDVCVDQPTEPMRHACSHTRKARTRWKENDARLCRAAKRFASSRIARITRLRKSFARHSKNARVTKPE